jgi:thioesterase domain-containing protein
MGIDQPFYGLQPQGLDGISKLHRTVPEMASHYIAEIRRKQPSGPYYLGGYSGGGVVAFEMAKQLAAAGERIGSLVFLDSIAPGFQLPSLRHRLDNHIVGLREEGVDYVLNFIKWAVDRRVKKVSAIARKPLRRLFPYHYRIEIIADTWNEAFAAYQPTPYDGEAMLFRASTGFVLGSDVGRLNGWERLVLGNIEVNECPGDHTSMCEQPHVRVLARRLRSHLQQQVHDNTIRNSDLTTSDTQLPSPSLAQDNAISRVAQKSTGEAIAS